MHISGAKIWEKQMVKKEQKRKPLPLVYSMSNLASAKENILARNYEIEGTDH